MDDPVDVLYKQETVYLKVHALCAQSTLRHAAGGLTKKKKKKKKTEATMEEEEEEPMRHTESAVHGTLFVTDYRVFFLSANVRIKHSIALWCWFRVCASVCFLLIVCFECVHRCVFY